MIYCLLTCKFQFFADKPNVLNVMGDQVQPNAGKTAYLTCIFEGLPMNVVWTKDGNRINYYKSGKTIFDADGKLTDTLQIYNVRRHMYGRYECNGTNDFGYAVAHMELKSLYIYVIHMSSMYVVYQFDIN
jgi:hypothetical protein